MSWSESQNKLLTEPRVKPSSRSPSPSSSTRQVQDLTFHEHVVSLAAGTLEMTRSCTGNMQSPLSPPDLVADITNQSSPQAQKLPGRGSWQKAPSRPYNQSESYLRPQFKLTNLIPEEKLRENEEPSVPQFFY